MLVSKHCEFGKQLVWCHISAGGHSLFSDGESAPTNRVSQKDRAPSRQGLFYVLTTFWPILSSQCTKTSIYLYGRASSHPVARAMQMLGEEHFATSWIQAGCIQYSGYFQFQPFLLAYFGEKAFFVFLHYKINRSKGVFWPKIPLNLTSEGLKFPPEVRDQHST